MSTPAPPSPIAAVRTTCPYCGVGCGLIARPDERGGAAIEGDPDHPANFGRTCAKGLALGETLGLDGRLLHPMVRGPGETLIEVAWNEALDRVAAGFSDVIARHGPDAIAFYLSGQLLTEDYYVANKLMKGFLGSPNVDTNSRLCMASSVAGHRRAFGSDTVPGVYSDLDQADLIVLVGSNAAWCHPVLFQRMLRNKTGRGARIVVIDPRRTATAEEADLFLPIAPGSDTALFCGLLVYLAERSALDREYITAHTAGFGETLSQARSIAADIASTARATELPAADVARFFALFQSSPRAMTCYSQGVNQSAQGTDKVNAIINVHLATGRIGKPGAGPFSLTGQPNAMGGREVGGLANQLAAHMAFTPAEIDRVRRFWRAPRMATREGRKAVEIFQAIERGQIKALWVMATNPAVSLPRAGAVRDGLKKLELFVVSDVVLSNDTINAGAGVLLPAAAWGEKDGTVTNSERRISRQRRFLTPPGGVRPDWAIICAVAQRMGFGDAFAFRSAADIFREHAALSAFENDASRDFDIGGLAPISDDDFEAMPPVQWPFPKQRAQNAIPADDVDRRFFAAGGFFTPDRKARFVPPQPPALREETSATYPLRLNTGRIRDQWHTMTRTGRSPRLAGHMPEPLVEIHPDDARRAQVHDGGLARITTAHSGITVTVAVSDSQQRGSLFVPIHWSDETASAARTGDLVSPATDPISGQPEAKATPAAIAPVSFPLHGLLRSRRRIALPEGTWWVRVAIAGQAEATSRLEYRFATRQGPLVWHDLAYRLLQGDGRLAELFEGSTYRADAMIDSDVDFRLVVSSVDQPLHFDRPMPLPPEATGQAIPPPLSTPPIDLAEAGPVVCACLGITVQAVRQATLVGAIRTVADVGRILGAGSHCGSCLPELRRLIVRALQHPEEGLPAPKRPS